MVSSFLAYVLNTFDDFLIEFFIFLGWRKYASWDYTVAGAVEWVRAG